ncbi:ATP-binding protein [Vibrio fluvialis]|nr:ATP-binding protein [Vibrio fluvialis]
MTIARVEIANLWGKELIEIQFKHRVTFLTGSNGSGKSTILNIIHDVLNQERVNDYHLVTTKNTNWAASVVYDNLFCKSLISICVSDEISLLDYFKKKMKETETLPADAARIWGFISDYNDGDIVKGNSGQKNYIFNSSSNLVKNKASHIAFRGVIFNDGKDENNIENYDHDVLESNTAFIFQEDRVYDKRNLKSKLSDMPDWNDFYISMDSRYESLVDDVRSFELKYSRRGTKEENADRKLSEFDAVIKKLDSYFEVEGKQIAWDDEQKITLKRKSDSEYTPWYMLSRGEKTVIYLFLAVFLYKDEKSVFLLDEPEISLHVRWQHTLIKDLSDIAPNSSFIIATHSPSLVQKGWHSHCLDISNL